MPPTPNNHISMLKINKTLASPLTAIPFFTNFPNFHNFNFCKSWTDNHILHFFQGEFVIWDIKVETARLTNNKNAIIKGGHKDKMICMGDILPWSAMTGSQGVAKGPPKAHLNLKISWIQVLRIWIELKCK